MSTKFKLRTRPDRFATSGERFTKTASWRDGKKSSSARGYTYEWQQARKEWLQANPFCVMCYAKGMVVAANTVDHIIPHNGDMLIFWDRTNWQSLCATCHSAYKQRQERAQR